jgi:ferritin
MIGEKMQTALNEQIREELGSAYLYLSMAAYFHSQGLDGMAQWMRVQTQEELVHAMKLFDHVKDRGGRVELLALSEPKAEWRSALEAFRAAYRHEQFITSRIDELAKLAEEEKDPAAATMLEWFVKEQEEEEESASGNVQKLEAAGESRENLRDVDGELGRRTFTTPAKQEGERT